MRSKVVSLEIFRDEFFKVVIGCWRITSCVMPGRKNAFARSPCRDSRDVVYAPRGDYAAGLRALGLRRSVLENARAEEGRCNPGRVQRQDVRKLSRLNGSNNKRRGCGVMIISRGEERDGTLVMSLLCVRVETLMELGRSRERNGEEKCADQSEGDRISPYHRDVDLLSVVKVTQPVFSGCLCRAPNWFTNAPRI
jgi:hypothetical protein